jgi:1-deoxy-D-xylulose-5-phosphate reductoisomerase
MRTPIAHALAYPQRIESGARSLDLFEVGQLNFERPDFRRFPCLRLAFDALRAGAWASVALNAANEIAVARFLDGQLSFTRIPRLIEDVLSRVERNSLTSIEGIIAADGVARALAEEWLQSALH